ncbi:MRC [Mytilus coruscus]|uniref:MRC n=1 Tax=Mytilus coruscus TaxID=42192 RepID=A0A6J8DDU4_MYTCO|nr:MRC [Mytilus coruscus]
MVMTYRIAVTNFCESLYVIILFRFIESYTTIRQLSGIYQNSFDEKYEDVNAVSINSEISLLDCFERCSNEQECLTIFYNRITKICILHSDPFTYTAMSKTGVGWRSYLTKDANIDKVYPTGICIQGTNTIDVNNKWTFFDGTPMTYFKWLPGEPNGLGFIRIDRSKGFGWVVPPMPNWWTATYMCEIRMI